MRTDPRMLLRGIAKFVAVVVVAGLAGAGIGIALAELSGNDSANDPILPATSSRAATSAGDTATTSRAGATTPAGATATTSRAGATTPASSAKPVYRVPRVQVLSALLGAASESTGRALVAVRVRVTNRGNRPLEIKTPALLSGSDEVGLGAGARDGAGAVLRPIAPGASATGVLRFTVPGAVAERLAENPGARLRVANRTVVVKLSPG